MTKFYRQNDFCIQLKVYFVERLADIDDTTKLIEENKVTFESKQRYFCNIKHLGIVCPGSR